MLRPTGSAQAGGELRVEAARPQWRPQRPDLAIQAWPGYSAARHRAHAGDRSHFTLTEPWTVPASHHGLPWQDRILGRPPSIPGMHV